LYGETSSRERRRSAASSLARAARVVVRAVAFGYFGLVVLGITVVVLPVQRLLERLTGRESNDELAAQRIVHVACRHYFRLLESIGLARVQWPNLELLQRRPLLIVANHPSLIDTPLLMCCMPQADFIVNAAWGDSPLLRRVVSAAGYLRADRGAQVVSEAVRRLRDGRCVVIYPEGSRTPREGMQRFHRGAAHIALEAGCDLLPIVIQVTPRTLTKGQSWSEIPDCIPEWRIDVGEPIHPANYLDGSERRTLAARRLTAIVEEYFARRWSRGGS
jgi:1-acyl-sn-glycerol-3-phosphate acyltransferase